MRVLIFAVILFIGGAILFTYHSPFNTKGSIPTDPNTLASSVTSKQQQKCTIFYTFRNRPVPASLGTVDLVSNSVYKDVDPKDQTVYFDLWKALDVPIQQLNCHLAIVQVSIPSGSSFSLPAFMDNLATTVTNYSTTTFTSTATAISPASIGANLILPLARSLLAQANQTGTVDTKIDSDIVLTQGVPTSYSDFNEQSYQQAVASSTSVATTDQFRQSGLNIKLTCSILSKDDYLDYDLSSSAPSGPTTQSGITLHGQSLLETKPLIILSSSRDEQHHTRQHLLFIPVGFDDSVHKVQDIIVISKR